MQRELNAEMKAAYAVKILPLIEIEARKRIEQGRSKTNLDERMEKMDLAPQNSAEGPDRHSRESRDKVAKLIGTSHDTVQRRGNSLARVCVVRKQ